MCEWVRANIYYYITDTDLCVSVERLQRKMVDAGMAEESGYDYGTFCILCHLNCLLTTHNSLNIRVRRLTGRRVPQKSNH
jgi:hypothetical protein